MKSGVRFGILTMCILLLYSALSVSLSAAAAEPVTLEAMPNAGTVYEGQKLEIVLSLKNLPARVACFDLQLESDTKRFELKKVTPLGNMTAGELHYNTIGSTTYIVYNDKDGGKSPLSGDGDVALLIFELKEVAGNGTAEFSFQLGAVGSDKGKNMGMASAACGVEVMSPPSGDALLSSLTPSAGRLTPKFSAKCFSYSLEVAGNVDRLTFRCKTAHPSAKVRINREALNGRGKSTRIIVTVTAENLSIQKYIITVLRRKDALLDTEREQSALSERMGTASGMENTEAERTPLKTRKMSWGWILSTAGLLVAMLLLFVIVRQYIEKKNGHCG